MQREQIRRYQHQLLLLSASALFWELTMIRYVPAAIRVVGYFTNLVLLSTFLGLGAGTILARRVQRPVRWFAPAALGTSAMALLLGLFDTGNPDGQFIWLGGPVDAAMSGAETSYGALQRLAAGSGLDALPAEAVIFLMMALLAAMFVPIGAAIGQRFAQLVPLRAYAWDIGGSIAGILLFTVLSALGTTPVVWFATGFLLLVPLVWGEEGRRRAAYFGVAVLTVALSWVLSAAYEWSPYQKIAVTPVTLEMMGERGDDVVGYELKVNNDYHQMALDLGASADGRPSLEAWRRLYDAPYRGLGGETPADVLVLGAGTGNDVMAALRSGAGSVTAVDIDPLILDLGQRLHHEHPYDDPRVTVVNDDARSFFKRTSGTYDAIVFGFLDSHTLLSSMSSVRIDTFVYTIDSFREARRLLRPGGRIVLTFAANERWIAERLYRLFDATFGEPPRLERYDYTNGVVFTATLGPDTLSAELARDRGDHLAVRHELPTDDWPYFYLQHHEIPSAYLLFILLVVLLGFIPMGLVPAADRTLNFQFFFLGAGFMLIETRSVTEMALLFGSTWTVNALTFGGILGMVFLANLVCMRWRRFPVTAAYVLVAVCVVLHSLVPASALLELTTAARVPLAILVLFSPIFFAGMAFSSSFRSAERPHVSFGSNLLGAMVGGGLEYVAMVFGFSFLDGVALLLYGLALLSYLRTRRPAGG